ncbi:hypothetical protein CK203_070923 [Vitis vinifera]|uniref:Uncharacterized protein n=1 Tax=Vitis vinifera TaxID=29760 RepID=A0A438E3M8_VITVI|nr:hypothetical protein CK203_070923 [Vitis vinifera]
MMRETGRCLSGEKNDPGDNAKIQLFSFFSLSNSSFILSPRDEITGSLDSNSPGLTSFITTKVIMQRMKTLLEQGFKLLDLLSVPVVSLLSWWVVDNILIIPRSTVHVISSRSALMLIFSLKLAASSSYNSLSLSKPPHIPPSRDQKECVQMGLPCVNYMRMLSVGCPNNMIEICAMNSMDYVMCKGMRSLEERNEQAINIRHNSEHQTEEDGGSKCQTEDMALNA